MNPKAKKYLIHTSIGAGLVLLPFLLLFFLRGDFSFSGYSDAFFLSFAVVTTWPLLVLIHRKGTFDVFHFGMARYLDQWRHNDEKKYENAGDYNEAMMEKRKKNPFPYWAYYSWSILCLALAIVFLILAEIGIH